MISPTAHAEDETSFIDLFTGDIIGTGPYMYDYYTPDKEVVLSRWEGYWKNLAHFKKIKFAIFDNRGDLTAAMFDHSVDYLAALDLSVVNTLCGISLCSDSSIAIKRFTQETGIPSLVYHYISFNHNKFNVTWRKALSYAINYTYIVEELRSGEVIRANTPISPGFGLPYNNSANAADYNLTLAREIMVSMGYGDMSWSDAEWIAVAEGTSSFREVGFFFGPLSNNFREELGLALFDWLKLIGISMYESDPCHPMDPLCINIDYEELDLYNLGWAPDYLSPFNMLDPLFNPNSGSNIALINDTKFNAMIADALNTTDNDARNEIYKNIQWYISEVGYFHAPLYHNEINFVHSSDLYGVPYNAMQQLEVYGIRRV
jgi:ABC-type transport system substrate-binding protein